MTQAVRASLRATGQIGVLAAVVNMAVSTADTLIHHIRYFGLPHGLLLFFFADAALVIAVGLCAFWASTQPDYRPGHRRMAIVASWLGVGIGVLQIAVYVPLASPLSLLLAKVTAEMLWPIGAYACLAISYFGHPLGLGEPGGALGARSPWIWMIAAPAVIIDIAIMWLQRYAHLPEASVLAVLTVGLLYGLLRRRHPLPGAARWAAATWPLIAMVIPTYAVNIAASTHNGLGRESIATAVALVILAGVVGVHLANRRVRPEGHDLGLGGGPRPTLG
jgi:hypothetical protein